MIEGLNELFTGYPWGINDSVEETLVAAGFSLENITMLRNYLASQNRVELETKIAAEEAKLADRNRWLGLQEGRKL